MYAVNYKESTMQFAYEEGRVDDIQIDAKQTTDGDKTLAELRVFCPRSGKVDGEWVDKGGFWITVTLWGERAERLCILEKGAWISFVGKYVEETWQDKESGEERRRKKFLADQVSLLPRNIESIQFRSKVD